MLTRLFYKKPSEGPSIKSFLIFLNLSSKSFLTRLVFYSKVWFLAVKFLVAKKTIPITRIFL